VNSAGTFTYYLRGQSASGETIGFFRNELMVVYLPAGD